MRKERNYVYAELSLIFKENFDLSKITQALGIKPTKILLTNRTTKNEDLWIKNGWEFYSISMFSTKNIYSYSTTDAILELFNLLGEKCGLIKDLVSIHHGKSHLCVVGFFEETSPSISLEPSVMEKLVSMNTSIEFDLYQ